MVETFIQMLFGWHAMLLSLAFAIAGVLFKRTALSIVGAILFLLPKRRYSLASWLIVPQLIVISALAIYVLTQ